MREQEVQGAENMRLTVKGPSSLVAVRILPRQDDHDGAGEALGELVADVLSTTVDQVRLGRHCPQCGAADHGRPVVVAPVDGRRLQVSLSRALGYAAVAVGSGGPLGVDIERVNADRFAGVADVVKHPDEPPARSLHQLAARWVQKEAVLKATGWGLTRDPSGLSFVGAGSSPFAVTATRDRRSLRVWVAELGVEGPYAAAVAVIGESPPRVTLVS